MNICTCKMSCIDYCESYENSETNSDLYDELEVSSSSSPFDLQWVFGFDTFTPVVNLSTANRSLIAYASSHVTVLYDYKSRKMFKLQGHRNCVRMLSIDQNGRWLLTADFDNDSTVVIWDVKKRIPIFTLFNPQGPNGMTAASLSPDAKYIVTVGNEEIQSLKIWYWTFGKNTPDAQMNLTGIGTDPVKDIAFDWQNPKFFALTTNSRVIFIQMDYKNDLIVDCPFILKKPSGLGEFNNTAFLTETSQAYTGTKHGFVLVWDVDPENVSREEIKMKHIKSIPLQKFSITKIINYSSMLVTGNSRGEIIFYDSDLQVLYACRESGLDSVTSISFDIQSDGYNVESERRLDENSDDYSVNVSNTSNSVVHEEEDDVEVASNVTIKIEHPPKPKNLIKNCNSKCLTFKKKFEKFQVPRDATLQSNQFSADKFIVATKNGKMACIDIPSMQCRKLSHYFNAFVTAIDVHPQDKYFVVGDQNGSLFLFNYANHQMMLKRNVKALPDLLPILKTELINRRIIHVTYENVDKNNDKLYPSVMKYSPNGDNIICALKNGAFWVLHPDTFEILDEIPYRHSETSILDVVFSKCSDYMAYYDDARTVVVFKRHKSTSMQLTTHFYDFIGKYRSHNSSVKCILFGTPFADKNVPRFMSLGEDKELIEYDMSKSGSYPKPGLVILEIYRVEDEHVPYFMDWYPQFGVEQYLVMSNSDHKLKLLNANSKKTRATVLGPTFDTPIKKMLVSIKPSLYEYYRAIHRNDNNKNIAHMIFATDRQIGLQLLPMDGNPYKILTAIGHPDKITWMRISHCGNLLFTAARNDRGVLMWKINYKSVEMTNRLGGTGLRPFYSLIDGGKEGWLYHEMQDLFVYAQILEQGKTSMKARRIDDEVTVEQLPNLMRAVGFYPSNYEMENLLNEIMYKHYASSGQLNQRMRFEEFVKLYINHRPTFGISMQQLRRAFTKLGGQESSEDDVSISKQQFFDILCTGKNGDALNVKEICKYLEYLIHGNRNEHFARASRSKSKNVLELLPERISYKDFVANVMGIKLPETKD